VGDHRGWAGQYPTEAFDVDGQRVDQGHFGAVAFSPTDLEQSQRRPVSPLAMELCIQGVSVGRQEPVDQVCEAGLASDEVDMVLLRPDERLVIVAADQPP
jgi:hypothetical protein